MSMSEQTTEQIPAGGRGHPLAAFDIPVYGSAFSQAGFWIS